MNIVSSDIDAAPCLIVPPLWELEQQVIEVAAEQCDLDPYSLSPESRVLEDLGIDSLALVELIMGVEEKFSVSIPDEVASQAFAKSPLTLRSLAALVVERWGTGTPARDEWRHAREQATEANQGTDSEELPFTQIGGRMSETEWLRGPLYDPIGPNREGFQQFRRRTDGMRCVLLPAGEAWLGRDAEDPQSDHSPAHVVRLSEFLMDAEPVSNAAFSRFLNAVGDVPANILLEWCGVGEKDKRGRQFPLLRGRHGWAPVPKTERQPMILVSWFGANAYSLWAHRCDWRFYRANGTIPTDLKNLRVIAPIPPAECRLSHLPSEAQWEHAARGKGSSRFPSAIDTPVLESMARVAQHTVGAQYKADSLPAARVSEQLGMSPFGLHHMAGNVWQWCRDWYAPEFYSRQEALREDPVDVQPTGIRSERGGSWVGPAWLAEPWRRRGRPPEARGRCLGFRCVGATEGQKDG